MVNKASAAPMLVSRKTAKKLQNALVPVTAVTPMVVAPGKNARKNKRKRNKRKNKGKNPVNTIVGEVESAWIAALNDPFENMPIPIGLGNMFPSEIATAYYRGSIDCNATDGSFQIWFSPGQWNGSSAATGAFITCDNLAGGTTPTFAAKATGAINYSAINNAFDQFRVLAAGIRVINSGSWGGASGILGSCVYPPDANANIPMGTSLTPVATNTLIGYPQMDWSRSYDPLQVLWRPTELATFGNFLPNGVVQSVSLSGFPPACVIVGKGGTVGATIYFEAIAHLEVYNISKGVIGGHIAHQNRATASAETMGGAYQSIVDFLQPASQSVVEWAKEATHTAAQSALVAGLSYAKHKLFRSRGHGFLGSSPYEMLEFKS